MIVMKEHKSYKPFKYIILYKVHLLKEKLSIDKIINLI